MRHMFFFSSLYLSLCFFSFIIFPQIIYDGFQAETIAGNETHSKFELVDILTGDVSLCFCALSFSISEECLEFL